MIRTLPAMLGLTACNATAAETSPPQPTPASDLAANATCPAPPEAPVRLAGGTCIMGQDAVYAEEGPPREATVAAFWLDPREVTNAQFAAVVKAACYVTIAKKPLDPAAFGVPREQIPDKMLLPGS
jgi:formylglycine-generating enzyme required for sulfatase activity